MPQLPSMQAFRSTVDVLRDRLAPITHTSTFRSTGQITPEEFLQAGDYLVYKFPSWSWSAAAHPSKAVSYLPKTKQYLVTRGVPCHRRLDAHFAGDGEDAVVQGGEGFDVEGEGEGWLSAGGDSHRRPLARERDVRSLGEKGEVEMQDEEDEEDIPDMDDVEEDEGEAIIPDGGGGGAGSSPVRTYNLYITYTPYYRTPRLYLSGYTRPSPSAPSVPLAPSQMLEDIAGDYKDKTVTLEDFPFFDTPVKTASVHPCRHAAVMKVLLDRADAALKLRREKVKAAQRGGAAAAALHHHAGPRGLEGLVDETDGLSLGAGADGLAAGARAGSAAEEWEEIERDEGEGEDEVAIRVDQYVVVFLKFMASVTPGIEHDFTMGV